MNQAIKTELMAKLREISPNKNKRRALIKRLERGEIQRQVGDEISSKILNNYLKSKQGVFA